MALAQWSTRRMAATWLAGLALQLALYIAPMLLTQTMMRNGTFDRVRSEGAARAERDAVTQATNAHWSAEQRANVEPVRTAAGDSLFPIVSASSERLSAERQDDRRASAVRVTSAVSLLYFGLVPLTLLSLTVAWLVARRRAITVP